jgi:outer membrane protein OmpA-like peptidoglycan-associated protein
MHNVLSKQISASGYSSQTAEDKRMQNRVMKYVGRAVALASVALLPVALVAQAASSAKGASNDSPSKWDVFAGYSYLAPKGTVTTTNAAGTSESASYDSVNAGGLFSGAYFFNKYVGLQAEVGIHQWGVQNSNTSSTGTEGNNDGFTTVGAGAIFRYPAENITPFAHFLANADRVGGPYFEPDTWGEGLTLGGGLDYETPWFNHHLAIRLFQADYEFMHADFGPKAYGGRANINAARLSTGVVLHIGTIAPPTPVTLAATASPQTVFPGDPVTVSATAGNLNPKDNVIYSWSGDGVTGNGTSATVATAALQPGVHTVQVVVKEGKAGKEGLKPWETATSTTSFTVKEFEPPTISLSVSPSTIKPGDTATVTAVAVSPQNRPLTYNYSASAGTVSGTGTTAQYSSAGAPTGAVEITGTVADDKGHTATASTTLTITAPYVPPTPHVEKKSTISFDRDKKRPTRVDNEAKATLDQFALDLKQQADAKAVLVGQSDEKEKAITAKQQKIAAKNKRAKVEDFAAQRAVNSKDYLVTEQGIDASRISVATTTNDGQTVDNYLVPSGASFAADVTGTSAVDETTVKPEARKPLAAKSHKAAKAK